MPDCTGRVCGLDGCGGTCLPGCGVGETCDETSGQCEVCTPDCDGRECGSDGCGASCGDCLADASCVDGICVCDFVDCDGICCVSGEICYAGSCCSADCAGRDCGSDGCGGTCGVGCGTGETCDETSGQCEVEVGEFVSIDPVSFEMGSPGGEAGRWSNEVQHTVSLTRSFTMLSTELTLGAFEALMGYSPPDHLGCGTDCPVEDVNWHEAAACCNVLSAAEGFASCYTCTGAGTAVDCEPAVAYATPYDCPGYRLPTEAEWEYAARAGTVTATYNGDLDNRHVDCEYPNDVLDSIAWSCGNGGGKRHVVSALTSNEWGLYDMLGNVWEWCHDWDGDYPTGSVEDPWGPTSGTLRSVRGGSWFNGARSSRAAARISVDPANRIITLGFRFVRTLP